MREARTLAAMLAILLFCCCTHFATALNSNRQFIKEVMELPVVDECDLGYVYEKGNEDNLLGLSADLWKKR